MTTKINVVYNLYDSIEKKPEVIKKQSEETIIKKLRKNEYDNAPIFEVICLKKTPYVKPYFDLDLDNEKHPEEFNKFKNEKDKLLTTATDFICKHMSCKYKDLAISESIYDKKISYHIVVYKKQILYEDLRKFKEIYKDEFKKIFLDLSPYGSTQKFRMVKTSKVGKNSPLIPITKEKHLAYHFITNINEDMNVITLNFPEEKIVKAQKEKVLKETTNNTIDTLDPNIKTLVNMLSVKRADEYHDWITLGFCLFSLVNNDKDSIELLKIWDEFSKKTTKKNYITGECTKRWKAMKKQAFTISTLYYWAKLDNPDEFMKFQALQLKDDVEEILNTKKGESFGEGDFTNIFLKIVKNNWVYIKNDDEWYYYENNKWNLDSKAVMLDSEIKTLNKIFVYRRGYYNNLLTTDKINSTEEVERIENKITKIGKLITMLKNRKTIKNIIDGMKSSLNDDDFKQKLNQNIHLLAFKDGVYELKTGIFRETLPSDYIEKTTKYNYSELKNILEEDYKKFIDIFNKIFANESQREYMLDLYSSCLNGFAQQTFHLLAGKNNSGGNGKGLIGKIMLYALGEYGVEYNSSILTQLKSKAGQATPELDKLRNVRFACASEPEKNSSINTGVLKQYTGGGIVSSRRLNKNQEDFIPQYKLFLECNDKPAVDSEDGGVIRRFRVIEFRSIFIKNIEDVDEKNNIYLEDETLYFSENLEKFGKCMMKMLLNNYKKLVETGTDTNIKITDDIRKTTDKYFTDTNVFINFLNENLQYTGDENHYLSLQTLYTDFTHSEIYKSLPKRLKVKKAECLNSLLKSKYEKNYYHENKIINEKQTKKHPKTKNYNILSCYNYINNIETEENDNYENDRIYKKIEEETNVDQETGIDYAEYL